MKLTATDYSNIASLIEEGRGTLEYTKESETLFVEYTYEVDGYVEDDYYNGTGGFVATNTELSVTDAESYTEDGERTENGFNECRLCNEIRKQVLIF